ncbi:MULTISPECIES: hypothetical protein [unclassified Bradyrhizobium]|uniref:hypothetical protein n=1 Tax=unclassified Bradyrhizobium TaxID=2631580 RepID=UPI001FFBB0B7|nr:MULTISPECIES: hypothetical protein [unclassified Bradyrhizobium]MCK1316009.1 hypothetical protein [Bradyrhizobium sp. 23]MCK1397605.1 hypothetical protein [Bradyrhizobium sp. 39]MCK1538263.1 hypothetical protein [Bradyrhizobium sp. 176]MCK1560318.1 hypothetical protein [Bradyrhizobium sp. 171]MCK1571738.1 hypothetical protein [Bradyrhizobium sp. 174]
MMTVASFLSFFGIMIGLVSVAFPLRFLYIRDRRMAAIVLTVSVVTFLPVTAIDGAKEQALARQEHAIAPTSKSPAELAEEVCQAPGAIPDCEAVLTKQIAEEGGHPKKPEPVPAADSRNGSCNSDWRQCSDNADLMNNFKDSSRSSLSCQYAAKKLAKYGAPSFPFFSFSNFNSGNDFVRTGQATLVEPDAEFQNASGTIVHIVVTCKYDLNSQRVVDVSLD